MKKRDFQKLCINSLTNNISDAEKEELNLLFEKSAENKLEYERIKKFWEDTCPVDLDIIDDAETEWIKLNRKLDAEDIKDAESGKIMEAIKSFFTPGLKPAITLGTVFAIILSSIIYFTSIEPERILKTVTTANNERIEIKLTDGSFVSLNSGSKIEYYENFDDDKREIKLNGEAFFSVKKDGRPFIISTQNAVTTVLGTQFNVWSREKETRVIVKEGKVRLSESHSSVKPVIIEKNEFSKVIEVQPPSEPVNVNAEEMLGWMHGKMIFKGTPLDEIAGELERYYDVKISLGNKKLSEYNLTGSFENEKIDTVLTKICLALDLKYIENENGYKLLE